MSTESPSGPKGQLHLVGRLVQASNATFLGEDDEGTKFVYKPVAGEAPLWDFPSETLANREIAAYRLSAAAGFDIVPETHHFEGPLGPGAVQTWIEDAHSDLCRLLGVDDIPDNWFGIVIGVDADDNDVALAHANHEPLRRMALFDVIANNADRKAGHILRTGEDIGWTEEDLVFGVDHGVTFHHEDKLRTVLWGFSGDPLTEQEMLLVHSAAEVAPDALAGLLTDEEIAATVERAEALIEAGHFPEPGDRWPVIPWPPV